MLRRIPILAFAVLLFAAVLVVPIGRSSAPTQLEPVKILAAMLLPQTAAAQARDTLDTLGGATVRVPVVEDAPASADSVGKPVSHSRGILIGTLVLIVVACVVVWLISRRDTSPRYESADAHSDRGKRGT